MNTPDSIDACQNLAEAFFQAAKQLSNTVVYEQALDESGDRRPTQVRTFAEVEQRVLATAHYMKSLGVTKGSKVAILSSTRPEWCEADIACLSLGAVVVSVYQSLPYDDIGYILFDSETEFVFAENQEQVDKLKQLLSGPIPIPATEDRAENNVQIGLTKIIAFEKVEEHPLVVQWEEIIAGGNHAPLDTFKDLKRDDLAALVYTSGTTGPPKGVMQTHGNHLANVRQAFQAIIIEENISIMMFLPLAHAFARLMGFVGFLTSTELKFPAIIDRKTSKLDPGSLTQDIRDLNANIFPIVPRLLEKMQGGVQVKASGKAPLRWAIDSALEVYRAKEEGRSASLWTRIVYEGTAILRKKVRQALFGEKLMFCVSGGAKLNPEVGKFFDAIGIPIIEGYGLTETAVATNINRVDKIKIGTVGPVLADDIEMRIAEDGEISYRGPNITIGYYKRPTATAQSWDEDGWFYTGDLGSVDEDGYLSIVGRKKEILVTSYGKNVAPEPVEAAMKTSEYVSHAVLVGDARNFCATIVLLDVGTVGAWLKARGVELEPSEYTEDERVKKLIWDDIEKLTESFADYEQPKKMLLISEDFTVDNGMLTPTFKVKRSVVEQNYKEQVDALYS